MSSFSQFALLPSLVASLREQGLTTPTEIQQSTLPALLSGEPLVGISQTGSGKTLAYVLPMLHRLKTLEVEGDPVSQPGTPRGVVMVPSRDLGEQVSRVFKGLTHGTRLRVRSILGGTRKQMARQNVAGNFEVLVATPGRLQQLLQEQLDLSDVRMVVLDEADQLMDPGFVPVVKQVLQQSPKQVQLVMFAATYPQALDPVAHDLFGGKPPRVRAKGSGKVVGTLTTDNRQVKRGRRWDLLGDLLHEDAEVGTLLFANTRKQCEAIAGWLDNEGYGYVPYMGEMERSERRRNLAEFRKGAVNLLLTTDLGGRGLDIERVGRVINVHLPQDLDNYLHRAGRTARAGRPGVVVNLVTERDQPLLAKLKRRGS